MEEIPSQRVDQEQSLTLLAIVGRTVIYILFIKLSPYIFGFVGYMGAFVAGLNNDGGWGNEILPVLAFSPYLGPISAFVISLTLCIRGMKFWRVLGMTIISMWVFSFVGFFIYFAL